MHALRLEARVVQNIGGEYMRAIENNLTGQHPYHWCTINLAITYALHHCAEAALPDLRKGVVERAKEEARVARWKKWHSFPFPSLLYGPPRGNKS